MINITPQLKANERWYNYQKFLDTRKWNNDAINFALCDISPESYKPFYFGINIIDKIVNNSKFNCGRAIWQSGKESMEWKTENPLRKMDVLGIGCYMYFQIFGIPGFIGDNKIQPLSKFRNNSDPIIILGGQAFYLINGYDKFIDIACIGDGEEWIIEILTICEKFKGNRAKILEESAKIQGSYVPSIHKNETITKRILPVEKLKDSILDKDCIESKVTRKVIEIARGCKYNCGFCSLAKRNYPFRENDYESIRNNIDSFEAGKQIYPFAPDEASCSYHEQLQNYCDYKGLKYFRYNFRLNTITDHDILTKNVSNQIVFGIDGISQRIIDLSDKNIKLKRLTDEIAPLIFKQNYALLKLNYVFNYDFETDEDYAELEVFWRKLIELRLASGNKTMIQVAPTPYVPEYFTPLQYFKMRDSINPRFFQLYWDIKKEYFDSGQIPMFKCQGLQGNNNWVMSVVIHRLMNLSDFVYFCYKNNYRRSGYYNSLFELFHEYKRLNNININDLFAEIETKGVHTWNRIDWSGGALDHIGLVQRRAEKMKRKAYEKADRKTCS